MLEDGTRRQPWSRGVRRTAYPFDPAFLAAVATRIINQVRG